MLASNLQNKLFSQKVKLVHTKNKNSMMMMAAYFSAVM